MMSDILASTGWQLKVEQSNWSHPALITSFEWPKHSEESKYANAFRMEGCFGLCTSWNWANVNMSGESKEGTQVKSQVNFPSLDTFLQGNCVFKRPWRANILKLSSIDCWVSNLIIFTDWYPSPGTF